jgi:integrase/recombinase XerD
MGANPTKTIAVYPYERIFDSAIKRLQSSPDVRSGDKTSITGLVEHSLAKGVSKPRTVKYFNHLKVLARMADKCLAQLGKKDTEGLMSRINAADYSELTKHDYKMITKEYFQWQRGCNEDEHEYPEEVRWIKTTYRTKRLVLEALLAPREIKQLVEATENPRDRAFILTDYELGCRIGEILSLRIVNVEFDRCGAVLLIQEGKTGPRRVRIIAAAPALASWLSIHPFRDDPNAPL